MKIWFRIIECKLFLLPLPRFPEKTNKIREYISEADLIYFTGGFANDFICQNKIIGTHSKMLTDRTPSWIRQCISEMKVNLSYLGDNDYKIISLILPS